MKVTLTTLKNVKYPFEIESTDTIGSIKQRVQQELKLGEVEEQKLIYVGKILTNDQTVEAAGINEGANIVIMISKKKTPQTQSAAQPSQSTSQPAPVEAPTVQPTESAAQSTPAASSTAPAAATTSSASSDLATGGAYDEAINQLMSFGFPREQVQAAMRAAFNNADRAAEYLFSGIPASALAQSEAPSATAPAAQPAAQTGTAQPAAESGAAGGGVDLSVLGDLTQLRTLIASNPQMLPALLSQLAQSNPDLVQQLEDDPEAFLGLMQALGIDPQSLPGMQAMAGGAAGGGVDEQGRHYIHITEEEQAQINNLCSFGFPRNAVIEAWLLCDRDQEMAAAYLLEHAGELAAMGDDSQFAQDDNMHDQGDDDEEDFDPSQYME